MASPYIQYGSLVALASNGGYNQKPALSSLSAVFLLSACLVLQQKWLWQNPIAPISDNEYQSILSMIESAMAELMINVYIGQILPSITDLSVNDGILLLDGALVSQSDYPELFAVVPASWIVGTDIQLPDMNEKSVHGYDGTNLGDIVGENEHVLTIGEMPSHTHIQDAHSHSYTQTSAIPTAAGIEPTFADLTTNFPSVTGSTIATNQTTGNNEAHNNVPESLAVQWFIVAR